MTDRILLAKKPNSQRRWIWGIFGASVFTCLYVFFTRVSPLYVFDLDDWYYVSYFRHPIPNVEELNPIKVLPETWMPLVSSIGAYIVYPITGDYIGSLAVTYAFFLAGMITIYMLSVMGTIAKWYHMKNSVVQILYGGIFLLLHFAPFLVGERNKHLFLSWDVTCVFNYIVPILLNFILWIYFFDQDKKWRPLIPEKMGILLLGIYFAVFSSLFHSIALMSLFGMQLLFDLTACIYKNVRQKKRWLSFDFIASYVGIHYPKLIALGVWFISMLFQLGGRADDISGKMQLSIISSAVFELIKNGLNPYFKLAVIVINAAAVTLSIYRYCRYGENRFLLKSAQILGSIVLTFVYLILVTSKLEAAYFIRADVVITWMGLLIFMTVFSLAYIMEKIPKATACLPIFLCCLICVIIFHEGNFMDYNVPRLPDAVIKNIDEDIISQIKEAEEQGFISVDVLVPESLTRESWPLDVEMTSERIADAFFRHGVTEKKMNIIIVPSLEKNVDYHLK